MELMSEEILTPPRDAASVVLLRQGEDVVQVHVLSPTRRDRTLPLATAVAGALQ